MLLTKYPERVSPIRRYGVALLVSIIALALTLLLSPLMARNPFLIFFVAVTVSAWYGGWGPGLFAIIFAVGATSYFFLPPLFTLEAEPDGLLRLMLFAAGASLICLMNEARGIAMEQARREREQLQVTLASITNGVIATDLQGHITLMNPMAEALTGWTEAAARGQDITQVVQIVAEETGQSIDNPALQALRTGRRIDLVNRALLIAQKGTAHPIEHSGAPIRSATGAVVGSVLILHDIGERRRAAMLLAQSEQRFQAAQELSLDAFTILRSIRNEQGVIIDFIWEYVNPMAAQLLRHPVEALLGQRLLMVLPENRSSGLFDTYVRVVETGQPHDIELFYNGEGISGWFRNMAVKLGDGLAISFSDITTRKRAEVGLRFLSEASTLLASTLDYQSMLSSVAHLALPTLGDWCMVDVIEDDETLHRLVAAHVDPVQEGLVRELQHCYAPDPQIADGLCKVLRTGEPLFLPAIDEMQLRSLAHNEQQLQIMRTLGLAALICVPLQARDRILGAISFHLGSSSRRYTQADLELAQELARRAALAIDNARLYHAAQQAIQVRDQFLSIAAHELKTPLTTLIGQSQLLERRMLREQNWPEQHQRTVHTIVSQTLRLNRMVEALLDLSRIQAGQLSIECVPFDMAALAQRLVEEMQPSLERHTLKLELAQQPLMVVGDELRLEQVLQNLIQNAIKYSPQGGPIRLRLSTQESNLVVAVQDSGIGIPAEALPQLFQRFYRAANVEAHRIAGVGIGLYVVKEIIQLHGGKVMAESSEGQGTTITFSLPLVTPTLATI